MASDAVKHFNATKGFGCICADGATPDVFMHVSSVDRAGMIGLRVDQEATSAIELCCEGREAATNPRVV